MKLPWEMMDELADIDISYVEQKNIATKKIWENTKSQLRVISDYLVVKFQNIPNGEISYEEVAKDLEINESSIKFNIHRLATWKDWILTIVNTPKKTGYFQLVSKDFEDSEKWITRNERYTGTKIQRLRKTRSKIKVKKRNDICQLNSFEKQDVKGGK